MKKYQNLPTDNALQSSSKFPSVANGLGAAFPILGVKHDKNLAAAIEDHRNRGLGFQKNNSFQRRFVFGTKPWGDPDKKIIQGKLDKIRVWNDHLQNLLPHSVRDSLAKQALPGMLLRDPENELLEKLLKVSNHPSAEVRFHANFWKEKLKFKSSQGPLNQSLLDKYHRQVSLQEIPGVAPSICGISVMIGQAGNHGKSHIAVIVSLIPDSEILEPCRVLVERTNFTDKWSNEDKTRTASRVPEFIHLSRLPEKPDLCVFSRDNAFRRTNKAISKLSIKFRGMRRQSIILFH